MQRSRGPVATFAILALFLAGTLYGLEDRAEVGGNVLLQGVPEIPEEVIARVEAYQNVRSASFRDWTLDGRGLFISTRFADVSQLHRVTAPGGARRQITFFDEPVRNSTRRPGSNEICIQMDVGGSEFFQLYLLDPQSGKLTLLTDGKSRNMAALWSADGKQLAYLSTRKSGRTNDVWVQPTDDPRAARMVVESTDGSLWMPTDWSRDGKALLVAQYISVADSRVHFVDLETGEMRLLLGGNDAPGNHTRITPTFSPDGQGVFFASNADSEFAHLSHLDLASGHRKILSADIPWDVNDFSLSGDAERAAFVVNEDGRERLYLLDPESFDFQPVEAFPMGLIGDLEFSPSGDRLAMSLTTPKTASDTFVLHLKEDSLGAGELVRWTFSELGGLSSDTFVEPQLIHYPTFDRVGGERRHIPAFVYQPRTEGPHPVLIRIHGGPEGQYRPSFNSGIQLLAAELGVAVIAPNVRGSSGYGKSYLQLDNGYAREDSVKDIGALLDWIETQPDLDASRVAVIGGSYGGYMVLASLVHYGDRLRAAVESVGISNFVTFLENTQDYRRDLRRVEYGDERDPEMRAFLERISPLNHAEKMSAPLLVAQGANDPRVPFTESEQIVAKVREAGFDVWYLKALNEGHGFRKKANQDLYTQIVFMFLRQHLLGEEAEAGAS
jgi:dipeptidyl aminopeptidase/acylaminoacyl peptidase